jgi:hypothetical protein
MTNSFDERPTPVSSGMVWQAVESSQIAEIGYEEGAEYPLRILFPPNKKQKAAGEPGSEYHYANVTPELHAEFLAAKDNPDYRNSIGVFFGQRIKPYPHQFPFVQVEAENPPQPPSSPNGGGYQSPTLKDSAPTIEDGSTTGETTSNTSINLAIIDSISNDVLFTPGAVTDAHLAAGREWYLAKAKKYGIETEAKRTELKRFARPLQNLRTSIEARAKEYTGETKRKLAAIDTEKRRLVQIVGGIEDDVLRPLTEWKQEEQARTTRLAGIVKSIVDNTQPHLYLTIDHLELAISALEKYDTSTMQEYKPGAESAIAASLSVLKPELERRQEAERNAAELAELRRKQAERDEADRLAEVKRKEEERIAAAVEAAKVKIQQEVIAELTPLAQQEKAHEIYASDVPELSRTPTNWIEEKQAREQSIHAEVVEALRGYDTTTRQGAMALTQAIIDGRVPHVAITY